MDPSGGGGLCVPIFSPGRPLFHLIVSRACPVRHNEQPVGNMFEWHFTFLGAKGTPFEGGLYHGSVSLPANYPKSGPSVRLLSPNQRFKVRRRREVLRSPLLFLFLVGGGGGVWWAVYIAITDDVCCFLPFDTGVPPTTQHQPEDRGWASTGRINVPQSNGRAFTGARASSLAPAAVAV